MFFDNPRNSLHPYFLCRWQIVSVVVMMLIGLTVHASSLEFLIEEQGREIKQTTQVENDRVVIRKAGGDPATDILFDATGNVLFVIDHRKKSYMRIDDKVVAEISALMNTVSDVVGTQQNVFSDLLSTFGIGKKTKPGNKPKPKITLQDSGRDLRIGGAKCRLYQAIRNEQLQAEACFTQASELDINATEYASLKKFAEFANNLLSNAGDLLDVLGVTVPAVAMQSVPGVPVGLNDQIAQRKVKLVEVNGIQGLGGMSVPDDYTQTAIPFTSG
ncbi:MAG: hypothetical protein KTR18_01850 [Acidiferrobacterales bacterium]|nr:hypothetical protein [Acidiferrobacterales bacterium]